MRVRNENPGGSKNGYRWIALASLGLIALASLAPFRFQPIALASAEGMPSLVTGIAVDWGTLAGATGSLIVKAVPTPTVLSTRILPWWVSMISRQEDSPIPVPPLPLASGPGLVV